MNATVSRINRGVWVYAVETPHYDPDYIEELKAEVPSRCRKWDAAGKVWLFKADAIETVLYLLRRHFGEYEVDNGQTVTAAQAYAELHLLPSAPAELVKVAYKTLAKLHHPDHGGDTATMQQLNKAYQLLK